MTDWQIVGRTARKKEGTNERMKEKISYLRTLHFDLSAKYQMVDHNTSKSYNWLSLCTILITRIKKLIIRLLAAINSNTLYCNQFEYPFARLSQRAEIYLLHPGGLFTWRTWLIDPLIHRFALFQSFDWNTYLIQISIPRKSVEFKRLINGKDLY